MSGYKKHLSSTIEQPPIPPELPSKEDCCGSGCTPCVFDIYQQQLEQYRLQQREWQARQQRQA